MKRSVPQSQEDLNRHFQEQLGFLERSAEAFDTGYPDEAKRLALTIRLLVHDTPNSRSLLSQLGRKDVKFLDSAIDVETTSLTSQAGLTDVSIGQGGVKHVAPLDTGETRWTDFESWWNKVVIRDLKGRELTRKDLDLTVANQDGGAHVDTMLDETYERLSRGNSLGRYAATRKMTPVTSVELVSIRQIAHELLRTLKPGYRRERRPEGAAVIRSATFHIPC
jgi:hypothetical protein